jgi:hypothetical protein
MYRKTFEATGIFCCIQVVEHIFNLVSNFVYELQCLQNNYSFHVAIVQRHSGSII